MAEDTRYRNYILEKVENFISICYESSYTDDISLNIDNIGELLNSLGVRKGEAEILDLTRNALIESNGVINPLDLDKALVNISLENGDEEEEFFEEAFGIIDLDNDGYITAPDIYRLFQKLNIKITDEGLITLLKKIDYDRDGKIDFEDFRHFMLGLKPQEPEIKVDEDCKDDDDQNNDSDDSEKNPISHLDIEALRQSRPSLRKLTKADSQFHLVSEQKRNLLSYAGIVKETSSVISYLRRASQVDQLQEIRQSEAGEDSPEEEYMSQDQNTLRRSSLRNGNSKSKPISPNANSLAPNYPSRRRSISRESSPGRNSLPPEQTSRRSSSSCNSDLENQNFLNVTPITLNRRPSIDDSCTSTRSRNNSVSITIPETVVDPLKGGAMNRDNEELLCLKDLCLTIADRDQVNGSENELSSSQIVNNLVEHSKGHASATRSPLSHKRQLSAESSANEYRDKDSSQKYLRDSYDPDNMTSDSRDTLFEFHRIASPSEHSIFPETEDRAPNELNKKIDDSITPRSKQSDMKPFFATRTLEGESSPRSASIGKYSDSQEEKEDVYVSLIEKYHRPHRRLKGRRGSSDSKTIGKCLKVRTLKKTKSVSKLKKEKLIQKDTGLSATAEIHVPTAGKEDDLENEEKRLREERLKSFTNGERKSGYVKSKNFQIPLADTPRTPTFPNPKRRLSSSSRPKTARPVPCTYPREYILGDSVTSKQLSNSMNSPRTLEEYNGIHSGYIIGHVSFEKPTVNGMQPLKTRKDSAPGISTWQHEFPSVSPNSSRPKTAVGIKRVLVCPSNKFMSRPFTTRPVVPAKSSNNSERDSVLSNDEILSSHNVSESEKLEEYGQSSSRRAECGDSNDSGEGDSSYDTSDLGISFNEDDFKSDLEKLKNSEQDEIPLPDDIKHGCQFITTNDVEEKGTVAHQAAAPKSPYKKKSIIPKSPLLMTRKSYPLGGPEEPLSDESMDSSSHRPHTARHLRTAYVTQRSHPPGYYSEAARPKTAGPSRRQSNASASMTINIVDMSPRSPCLIPRTARANERFPHKETNSRSPSPFPETAQSHSLETEKVITDSFPVPAFRRRKSLGGTLTPTRDESIGSSTASSKGISNIDDAKEGSISTPRSPNISSIRRPKSSICSNFSRTSEGTSEVNLVNMSDELEKGIVTARTPRKCSFKPLTRAIMALNQTRRIAGNTSISRSLETKSILLQHDDLSKTKKVAKPDAVPVLQENSISKMKTVITLEIPQI